MGILYQCFEKASTIISHYEFTKKRIKGKMQTLLSNFHLTMNTKTLIKALGTIVIGMTITAAGCQALPSGFKNGDKVVALWSGTQWYEGTTEGTCDKGYTVKWADGTSPSCVLSEKVVANKVLTKETATVGTPVFAKWAGWALYEAKISAVNGDKYSVEYYDGSKKDNLKLDDLRGK